MRLEPLRCLLRRRPSLLGELAGKLRQEGEELRADGAVIGMPVQPSLDLREAGRHLVLWSGSQQMSQQRTIEIPRHLAVETLQESIHEGTLQLRGVLQSSRELRGTLWSKRKVGGLDEGEKRKLFRELPSGFVREEPECQRRDPSIRHRQCAPEELRMQRQRVSLAPVHAQDGRKIREISCRNLPRMPPSIDEANDEWRLPLEL